MKTAIVLGVGPDRGMGAQLCHRAAKDDYHTFVAGRTLEKVQAVASSINNAGGNATAVQVDATNEDEVVSLFAQAAKIGPLNLAIYNAGNASMGPIETMEKEFFEDAWRVCCLGGFLFGREGVRRMKETGGGTILFTGASASLRGVSNFGAFNSGKAALRAFCQALSKEYGKDRIHVGHVVIDGAIDGEKIRNLAPDYADSLGDDGMISIDSIVDAYQYLWRQPPSGWSFEIDIRTAIENW